MLKQNYKYMQNESKINCILPDTTNLNFYGKNNLHYYQFSTTYRVVKKLKDNEWWR